MTWRYEQSTGKLFRPTGHLVCTAYSGHGDGVNNPEMEDVRGVGPIPRGRWIIGTAEKHPRLGPLAMPLHPSGHDAHGRSEFFIHGDNARGDRSASHGCIIVPRAVREDIAASADRQLDVV